MKALAAAIACSLGLVAGRAAAQPLPPTGDAPYPGVMRLQVDATDLDRKIFRATEHLPVRPGPLVLYHPQWLPGTHAPIGPITQFTGLKITAAGKRLEWQRNTVDGHAFHVEVPAGADTLDIEFQFVSPIEGSTGRVVATPEMLGLQWNAVLLYPAGYRATNITVQPSLTLPAGWSFGSALEVAARQGSSVDFKAVSVETLVDSPVFAGKHFVQHDLDPGAREAGRAPVWLNIVADEASQLAATQEQLAAHRALVTQADRVFGARHYARYDFLLALSEQFGGIGLEHHQSSENGVKANYFTEWAKGALGRDLLPHEYVHSWNGKFRRPADLLTPHFNTPMQNTLLWVYEGQTQFWGAVLAARSGLVSPTEARDELAVTAAWLDARAGRAWRNLQDTTHEPTLSSRGWQRDWRSWQRGGDYYDESRLIWIEADMLIREASGGRRSLDDFARAFFGVEPGRVTPLAYTFDDVVGELNRVQPHDWAAFLRQRLDTHERGAPLQGLARSGWKLAWSEEPNEISKAYEAREKSADFAYSLGFDVGSGDKLHGVVWGSPAFDAGLAPGATLLAVNGRAYKADGLKQAVTAAKASGAAIELLVKTGELFRTVAIKYGGGLRYPKLERIEGVPDRLSELFKAR